MALTGLPMTLTGLLLAGGRSERMGRDKVWLPFGGEPLVHRTLRVLDAVADEVIVASGDGKRLAALGRLEVADVEQGAGPLAGLVAGLEAASHPLVAVVAVDMPHASAPLLRLLARCWRGEAAVVPVTDHGPEPLHAVWARDAAAALQGLLGSGQRSARAAAATLGARHLPAAQWRVADPAGRFADNLNRPGDLPG